MKAGKRTAKEIKELINASYSEKPPETIDGWVLDKDLSVDTAKVYYNPKTGEANVIHRGTSGISDWLNNASYVLGTYESTDRYKQGKKVQKKAEKKYGAENISTLGHSQGSVLSRKLGKNTKEIINVNPAYKGEKELKNEYNIRSKTDVVSGAKGLVDLIAPSKKTTTISSKNPLDILGEHSPDVLDRLGNKNIGVGAGNIISSNNIMKIGGHRTANLNYTGEDIDWYNGGILPESAYQNIGKTPIGVIGGDRDLVGGDIFKKISKGVKKLGKSVSKGVEKATESIGKAVDPVTQGVEKATESVSKVTDKINPMSYALDSKPISKAMGSLGDVTHDYILPAVVSAGKPIYDAAAMAASTALTGNPVLGKVAADTLWNEMVAKKGIDPRQNQKSKLLGELATTAGKTAAAEAGGSRRKKGGGGGSSTLQNVNLTPIINYLTLQQLKRLPKYKRTEYIDIIRDIVSNFINTNPEFFIQLFNVRRHQRREFSIPELDAIVDERITISDDGESNESEREDDSDNEEIRVAESTNGSGRKGKMIGGVLKRDFIVGLNMSIESWDRWMRHEAIGYSRDLIEELNFQLNRLKEFREILGHLGDDEELPNDLIEQGAGYLREIARFNSWIRQEDDERRDQEDAEEALQEEALQEQMGNLQLGKRRRGNGRGKMKGGVRKILKKEVEQLNRIMKNDDDSGFYKNVYRMTPKQIARAFSFICIEILPNTPKGVLINTDNVRRWVVRANAMR